MNAYLFPGWAFPATELQPIADALKLGIADAQSAELWIGWSLGAIQALSRCKASVPHGMILISATARFCGDGADWPGLPAANLRALQRQLARTPDAALQGFHRLCAEDASDEEIESRTRASLSLPLADGLRELAALDVRTSLQEIVQPVLLLHGARDRVIPIEAARVLASLLPNARLVVHEAAAHDLPIRHRDWVLAQARDFWRNCEPQ